MENTALIPTTKPAPPAPVAAVGPAARPAPGPYLVDPATYRRQRFLGGSDIASILGVSPYRSGLDCWLDKTDPDTTPDSDNPATRRGKRMEPVIRQWASEDYGVQFEHVNRRFAHHEHAFMAAEIDAESREGGEWINNEIKSVHPFMAREWGEQDTDALPLWYLAQVQWGMGVTGRGLCRVYMAVADELRTYVVVRDEYLIREMQRQGAAFWREFVVPRVRPDADPKHARVFETLRRLFPGTSGETIVATPTQEALYTAWQHAQEQRALFEKLEDSAKAALLYGMGEAAQLAFADGQALKRAKRERKGYTVEATEYWDTRFAKLAADKPAKGSKPAAPALIEE